MFVTLGFEGTDRWQSQHLIWHLKQPILGLQDVWTTTDRVNIFADDFLTGTHLATIHSQNRFLHFRSTYSSSGPSGPESNGLFPRPASRPQNYFVLVDGSCLQYKHIRSNKLVSESTIPDYPCHKPLYFSKLFSYSHCKSNRALKSFYPLKE